MTYLSRRARDKMGSEVRQKIMEAIERGGEIPHATILAIMLGVLDEIRDEIASIRGDLPGLRQAVLNGHVDVHHEHHEWLTKHIQSDCDDVCAWARTKIAEEKENYASRRRVFEGWASEVGRHIITIVLTIFGLGLYAYFS